MVTSGASKGTFSPGWTWRLATVPDNGAVTTASRSALRASWTCASLDLSVPWVTDRLLSALSYAVLRDEILLEQRLILRPRLFGQRELRAARFQRADAVGELRFEIGGVEADDRLSRLDRLALADHDLADLAGHLGFDRASG